MSSTLSELRNRAAADGLNLCGIVDAQRFDRCQSPDWRVRRLLPECGTVVLLGSGGRQFWQQMLEHSGRPRSPAPGYHPVRDHARRCVDRLVGFLREQQLRPLVVLPEDKATLNFVQLAEAAGFGTVSPVMHLLLHPTFGSWVSLRAALLLEGYPFGAVPDASLHAAWQPCSRCDRPCVTACPIGVHDGSGGSDFGRCAEHRDSGECATGCSARQACPVGVEHRYSTDEEAHRQAYNLFAMRKWYGLGIWRFVPRFLRT